MEKEEVYQISYEQLQSQQVSSQVAIAGKQEAKTAGRHSTGFLLAGLVAIGAGVVAGLTKITGLVLPGFSSMPFLVAVAGVTAVGFGVLKIWQILSARTIDFPSLTIRKKEIVQPAFEQSYRMTGMSKSGNDKVLAGVCGGIAERSGISPAIVRLLFIIAFFFSGGLVTLVYIILAAVLPDSLERRTGKSLPPGRR